jgi:hypothetical protein
MLPFQIDPSWYERYWYGEPPPAKGRLLPALIRLAARLSAWGLARPHAREALARTGSRLGARLS